MTPFVIMNCKFNPQIAAPQKAGYVKDDASNMALDYRNVRNPYGYPPKIASALHLEYLHG